MNKPITIAASLAVLTYVFYSAFQLQTLALRVTERFPDIDPSIVEAAFWTLIRKSVTGQGVDLRSLSDAEMDQLLLLEIDRLNNHK